jgi:hypothetical protein
MNDPCPVCGLLFQREEGYFLGAMYVSYLLSAVLLLPCYLAARWLLPGWGEVALLGVVVVLYLPLVPAVFRYSRGIWIHFERWMCPDELSATVYEKTRQKEFERAARRDQASEGPEPPGEAK